MGVLSAAMYLVATAGGNLSLFFSPLSRPSIPFPPPIVASHLISSFHLSSSSRPVSSPLVSSRLSSLVPCLLFLVHHPLSFFHCLLSSTYHRSSFILHPLSFVLCLSFFFFCPSSFIHHPFSFVLHSSSFIFCPSSFVFHSPSFVLSPSSFRLCSLSLVLRPLSLVSRLSSQTKSSLTLVSFKIRKNVVQEYVPYRCHSTNSTF